MSAEVDIGLLTAATTIIAALIQRSWNLNRTKLPKHESIEYQTIHEDSSFSVTEVVKILDLSAGIGTATSPGRAVQTDTYLVRREFDKGNGMVFRYATSGSLEGTCLSHIDNHLADSYLSAHFKNAIALSVPLQDTAVKSSVRITNQVVFLGAFDKPDGEDFETHVERPTRSLVFIVKFSPTHPCRSAQAFLQLGERGHAQPAHRNAVVISQDGTLLYWRITPRKGVWLPIGAKYMLKWAWEPVAVKRPSRARPVP